MYRILFTVLMLSFIVGAFTFGILLGVSIQYQETMSGIEPRCINTFDDMGYNSSCVSDCLLQGADMIKYNRWKGETFR